MIGMVDIVRQRRVVNRQTASAKKKIIHVSAVLTADLHIRPDTPLCRTDDFQAAMWSKLKFIFFLCRKYEAPLIIAGDIGHRSQWPNWLLERFIDLCQGVRIVACFGQHDLPAHNLEELPASGCGVLTAAGAISSCGYGEIVHYGQEILDRREWLLLVAHRMVIQGKNDWPGQQGDSALSLLKKYPQFKLILTGDNHRPFVEEHNGRILVNPGSMMRMTSMQADHQPRVYLWDDIANEVESVYLPIEPNVVDRSHIEEVENRDERISRLVERIKIDYDAGFSFRANMESQLKNNPVRDSIERQIWEVVDCEQCC